METPLLDISDLSVSLGNRRILRGVSLQVGSGELHGIIGPNGAGKTTLIRAILRELPFKGDITCRFRSSGQVGYVPQRLEIDRSIPVTVEDFLGLCIQRRGLPFGVPVGRCQLIRVLLARTQCEHLEDKRLAVLSGGELQRVALAQALFPEPELLLLDEATSSIDSAGRQAFDDLIARLRVDLGMTVIMVGHHLPSLLQLCDRVSLIDGDLRATGRVTEVTASTAFAEVFGELTVPPGRDVESPGGGHVRPCGAHAGVGS